MHPARLAPDHPLVTSFSAVPAGHPGAARHRLLQRLGRRRPAQPRGHPLHQLRARLGPAGAHRRRTLSPCGRSPRPARSWPLGRGLTTSPGWVSHRGVGPAEGAPASTSRPRRRWISSRTHRAAGDRHDRRFVETDGRRTGPAATRAVRSRPSSRPSARPAGRSSTSPTNWASAGRTSPSPTAWYRPRRYRALRGSSRKRCRSSPTSLPRRRRPGGAEAHLPPDSRAPSWSSCCGHWTSRRW